MAEHGQGLGRPEVAEVQELVGGLDSLAVASGGHDGDAKPDEGLAIVPFGTPPPTEDCPLCFIPLPRAGKQLMYVPCCGQVFCGACAFESERVLNVKNAKRAEKKLKRLSPLCPFCRTPAVPTSDEELVRRYEKRAEKGDKIAIFSLAGYCRDGHHGLAKDLRKYYDLVRRAADLGHTDATTCLGRLYAFGEYGGSLDEKRGRELLEKAAKSGNTHTLVDLAALERENGRTELSLTYLRTAAAAGDDYAVKDLWKSFRADKISKDGLLKSLWAHQKANEDMRSEERERYKRWTKAQEEKKQAKA